MCIRKYFSEPGCGNKSSRRPSHSLCLHAHHISYRIPGRYPLSSLACWHHRSHYSGSQRRRRRRQTKSTRSRIQLQHHNNDIIIQSKTQLPLRKQHYQYQYTQRRQQHIANYFHNDDDTQNGQVSRFFNAIHHTCVSISNLEFIFLVRKMFLFM